MTLIVGLYLGVKRPPQEVTAVGGLSGARSTIEVEGTTADGEQVINAASRDLSFEMIPFGGGGGAGVGGTSVRVALRVDRRQCHRLARAVGGRCGAGSPLAARSGRLMSIEWLDPAALGRATFAFRGIDTLALSSDPVVGGLAGPGSWIVEPVSRQTRARVGCDARARFAINVPSKAVKGRCTPNGRWLHMRLRSPNGRRPSIAMNGVDYLRVVAFASRGKISTEPLRLQVGEATTEHTAHDEVAVEAAQGEVVELAMESPVQSRDAEVTMKVALAESVQLNETSEQVPTLLDRHSGSWNSVLFMFLGLLAGVTIGTFRRSE